MTAVSGTTSNGAADVVSHFWRSLSISIPLYRYTSKVLWLLLGLPVVIAGYYSMIPH